MSDTDSRDSPPRSSQAATTQVIALREATSCYSLNRILSLLDKLGFEIDRFMGVNAHAGDPNDDGAHSWMNTALEDMSATLVGVSTDTEYPDNH